MLTNSDKIIEADAINKHENEGTSGEGNVDEVSKKYVPKQDFADLAKVSYIF